MVKRKVTRKQFNEGVAAYREYMRVHRKKTITVAEAEKYIGLNVTVAEKDNIHEVVRQEGVTIRESTEEFKPDFGLLGLKPEETKIANNEKGNTDPKTMTNEDWNNLFRKGSPNGR